MIGKALLFAAKVVLWLFLALFVLALFGPIIVPLVEILFTILIGWIKFLGRVLPEVSLNPSAIAFAIICSGLLIWAAQWFCGWLYVHFRSRLAPDSPWPVAWPWHWSVGLYCGVWLSFLTSMSVTGVAHQVGWLVRSEQPIIENRRPREKWEIGMVANQLSASCERMKWDSQTVRAACKESLERNAFRQGEPLEERWHTVFIETKFGAVEAVFIAYRDAELRRKYGYRRVTPQGVDDGPIERLAEDIRTVAAKANASVK